MTNDEKIAEWVALKPRLWGLKPEDLEQPAILVYVLRCLSRGRVPRASLVLATLNGERAVPACGFIECFIDGDHVH